MQQDKIGKFISMLRKGKKMTQLELANKLGVTDRAISKWENGRGMPDLSLMKPLCKELGITINELLSGEKIGENEYQENLEKNIINTIEYSNKKINQKNNYIGILLITFGILISITAIGVLPSESSWSGFYSILGGIISLLGLGKFTRKISHGKRMVCNFGYFSIYILILFIIDYFGVIYIHQAPRFSLEKITFDNMIIYKTPFYNVYQINKNTENEYYIIDTNKQYTEETVPNIPFNRDKSGIDNIIKYKSKYIGDNSNNGNLINNLPLSEYGYVFEIDSDSGGLIIDYHITDWYINVNNYLEKSLIYNSVSIFSLIDNVNYIKFNFSGKTYYLTRKQLEQNYPNYNEINNKELNKDKFNQYLENKINDEIFIDNIFNKLFQINV